MSGLLLLCRSVEAFTRSLVGQRLGLRVFEAVKWDQCFVLS